MRRATVRLAPAFFLLAFVASAQQSQRTDPPSITYGGSRTSKGVVETQGGNVFVDDGVAWKGVKVYLSLTWDLVATDEATGKALWAANVGAFWNAIGFKEIETAPGQKTWAVELRPGPGASEGRELRQYHELATGKLIAGASDRPAGDALTFAGRWDGRSCASTKALRRLVESEADWKTVTESLFAGIPDAPQFPAIDFKKNVVLVLAMGEIWNCSGMDASAWENEHRILVRVREHWFQTAGPDGGGERVRPFGIFVLPRRDPFKTVIVERNYQNLIGGPAIWKELCRFEKPGDARPASRK